jgi:prefoldin subunit 5
MMTPYEFDQLQNNLQLLIDEVQRLSARVAELEKQKGKTDGN